MYTFIDITPNLKKLWHGRIGSGKFLLWGSLCHKCPQYMIRAHWLSFLYEPKHSENKRQQFWFCCHMLSGYCQAGPYLE